MPKNYSQKENDFSRHFCDGNERSEQELHEVTSAFARDEPICPSTTVNDTCSSAFCADSSPDLAAVPTNSKSSSKPSSFPLYSTTSKVDSPADISYTWSIGFFDIPYYSTLADKVLEIPKRIASYARLLAKGDDEVFIPSALPIFVLPPDEEDFKSSGSFFSSSTCSIHQGKDSFSARQSNVAEEISTENPGANRLQQNIGDIIDIQAKLEPSSRGSPYSLISSLRQNSVLIVAAFFLLSTCTLGVYFGVSKNADASRTIFFCGLAVNVCVFLALISIVYAFFWRMDAQYYLEALNLVLAAAKDFQLCQSIKKIEHPEHFKSRVVLGFEMRTALQKLVSSLMLSSYKVESLNELLEIKEAESRQQLQDPLPSFHPWQGSSKVQEPIPLLLLHPKREGSKKDSVRRTELDSSSTWKRSAPNDLMQGGQNASANQFFSDLETFESPTSARGGQSDAATGGEIGPMVVYIICKLFINDLTSKIVSDVTSSVLSLKLHEMMNAFSDAVTHTAAITGGVVVGIELDSAIITYNAFLPMPAVSAMSTAYKAAVSLDLELASKKNSLTGGSTLDVSWGMVLQQGRLIVENGGTKYIKQPYVYSPDLEFGYQVVELCRILKCTVLSLVQNTQSNRSVQIIPVDVIGVAPTHTKFLCEIKLRNAEDTHIEEKMIHSLLELHNHHFDQALLSLLEIKDDNHNAKRMCYLAAYFKKLARQKRLKIPSPYYRSGPSWEFMEILALQVAASSNFTRSILESTPAYQELTSVAVTKVPKNQEHVREGSTSFEKEKNQSTGNKSTEKVSESVKEVDSSPAKDALTPIAPSGNINSSGDDSSISLPGNKLTTSSEAVSTFTKALVSVTGNKNSYSARSGGTIRGSAKLPTPFSGAPSTSFLPLSSISHDNGFADILELEGSSQAEEPAVVKDISRPFSVQESFNQSLNMSFKIPSLQSSIVVGSLTRSQMVSARKAQRAVVVTGNKTASVNTEAACQVLKFSLGDLIANGSGGTKVLRGLHPNGRIVAIKQVPIDGKSVDVKAAEGELETLTRLKHPNILRYIASCYTETYFYIIMEFVSGGSLADLIRNFGPLPEPAIHRYTIESLAGLEYLHRRGIVHRDISCNNIMVTIDGECKIADFFGAFLAAGKGITPTSPDASFGFQWNSTFLEMSCASMEGSLNLSLMGSPQTVSARHAHGKIFGTPIYMSPQAARGIVDAKNDIWSLGIVLCYCSTGCIPFKNEDLDVPSKVFLDSLSVGKVKPVIPKNQIDEGLENFIRLCLEEELDDRPTASQLLKNTYILQSNYGKPNDSFSQKGS